MLSRDQPFERAVAARSSSICIAASSIAARQLLAALGGAHRGLPTVQSGWLLPGGRRGAPRRRRSHGRARCGRAASSRRRKRLGIAQQDVKLACLQALEAALELEDRNKAEEVLAHHRTAPGRASSAASRRHCASLPCSARRRRPCRRRSLHVGRRTACARSSCRSTSRSSCSSTANGSMRRARGRRRAVAGRGPGLVRPARRRAVARRATRSLPAGREPEPVPAG